MLREGSGEGGEGEGEEERRGRRRGGEQKGGIQEVDLFLLRGRRFVRGIKEFMFWDLMVGASA